LLLLLVILSALHLAGVRNFIVSADRGGLQGALLAALTFRVNVLEATRGYLPANWDILWSLSIEWLLSVLQVAGFVLLSFSLCFSRTAEAWGLRENELDMTLIAIGTCMLMIVAFCSKWKASWLWRPLLAMGRSSYEIYLTHMFVVFALFEIFLRFGKPLRGIPLLFISTLLLAAWLGALTAQFFAEPMNRRLRKAAGSGSCGTILPLLDSNSRK
jgi:peptidoglycan/LPS O-acetylase OafA/YrhL